MSSTHTLQPRPPGTVFDPIVEQSTRTTAQQDSAAPPPWTFSAAVSATPSGPPDYDAGDLMTPIYQYVDEEKASLPDELAIPDILSDIPKDPMSTLDPHQKDNAEYMLAMYQDLAKKVQECRALALKEHQDASIMKIQQARLHRKYDRLMECTENLAQRNTQLAERVAHGEMQMKELHKANQETTAEELPRDRDWTKVLELMAECKIKTAGTKPTTMTQITNAQLAAKFEAGMSIGEAIGKEKGFRYGFDHGWNESFKKHRSLKKGDVIQEIESKGYNRGAQAMRDHYHKLLGQWTSQFFEQGKTIGKQEAIEHYQAKINELEEEHQDQARRFRQDCKENWIEIGMHQGVAAALHAEAGILSKEDRDKILDHARSMGHRVILAHRDPPIEDLQAWKTYVRQDPAYVYCMLHQHVVKEKTNLGEDYYMAIKAGAAEQQAEEAKAKAPMAPKAPSEPPQDTPAPQVAPKEAPWQHVPFKDGHMTEEQAAHVFSQVQVSGPSSVPASGAQDPLEEVAAGLPGHFSESECIGPEDLQSQAGSEHFSAGSRHLRESSRVPYENE